MFEGFIREAGTPAPERVLPPRPDGPPDMAVILPMAARHGFDILGPPGPPPGRSCAVAAKKRRRECQARSSSLRPTGSSRGSSPTRGSECRASSTSSKRNESRLIAFNEYASEDGTEVAVVQIHPDADSMTFHMGIVAERAAAAYAETVEATTSIQVFGMPSDGVLGMLERQAGGGVPLSSESSPASAARGVLMEGLQGQPGRPRRLHEAAHSATPHGSAG